MASNDCQQSAPAAKDHAPVPAERGGAGDHADDLVGVAPRLLAIADNAPAAHDPNSICDAKDLIEIVADDQYRQPLPLQCQNDLFDRLRLSDAERGCRLVHENEFRPPSSSPRNRHNLPLPAGQQFDRLRDRRHVAYEPPEHLACLGEHAVLVEDMKEFRPNGQFAAEIEVRPYREVSGKREVLIDSLDALLASICGRGEIGRLPQELDRSGIGRQHATDHLDEGRFSGAIVADQSGDLAGRELKCGVLQSDDCAEALAHSFHA